MVIHLSLKDEYIYIINTIGVYQRYDYIKFVIIFIILFFNKIIDKHPLSVYL